MLVLSFLSLFITLLLFTGSSSLALLVSLPVAALATVVEAVSPWGLDNLLVPAASAWAFMSCRRSCCSGMNHGPHLQEPDPRPA